MNIVETIQRRRQVTAEAEAAKQREREAVAAAESAREARLAAERAVGPAKKAAAAAEAELGRSSEHQLRMLREAIDATVKAEEAETGRPVPSRPDHRLKARTFLYGGSRSEPVGLAELAQADRFVGAYLESSRVGGRLMAWVAENEAGGAAWTEADRQECRAWSLLLRRVRRVAGEDV